MDLKLKLIFIYASSFLIYPILKCNTANKNRLIYLLMSISYSYFYYLNSHIKRTKACFQMFMGIGVLKGIKGVERTC